MRVDREQAGSDPRAAAAALRRAAGDGDAAVASAVAEIIERVRDQGDRAVLELTERFDTGGEPAPALRVAPEEVEAAEADASAELRAALELAADNVRTVAAAALEPDRVVELEQGQRVVIRELPVRRAAIYVPGGRAPYPSTVVMGAVTARVAGVEQVAVCAPPARGGAIDPAILVACGACGVAEIYRMGGAQAIAALAYGTAEVARVDVVVGPGNPYVQEAKRRLAHRVGIDGYAGPSELLLILDEDADSELAALDLLAQSEHGQDSPVIALAASAAPLDRLESSLRELGAERAGPGSAFRLVELASLQDALAFADEFAPEHLQLVGAGAEALAPQVRAAGAVFVGARAGTAFGDYVAGSNHVLPTGGAARFSSALSPRHFRRRMAEIHIDAGPRTAELARAGALIARAEGFPVHAESMEARIRDNEAG